MRVSCVCAGSACCSLLAAERDPSAVSVLASAGCMSAVDEALMSSLFLAVKEHCPGLLCRLALPFCLQLHCLGCHDGEEATVARCACFFWLLGSLSSGF